MQGNTQDGFKAYTYSAIQLYPNPRQQSRKLLLVTETCGFIASNISYPASRDSSW